MHSTTLKDKTDEEICEEIKRYLQSKSGVPLPSLEDFCIRHGYDIKDIIKVKLRSYEVEYAIRKIRTQAIVTLEKFLLLDVSNMEFSVDNKQYKLDKKGIIYQLKILREQLKE